MTLYTITFSSFKNYNFLFNYPLLGNWHLNFFNTYLAIPLMAIKKSYYRKVCDFVFIFLKLWYWLIMYVYY